MTHGVGIKTVFSDDEEEGDNNTAAGVAPALASMAHTATGFLDPMLTSTAYHIHQAESALVTLKQIWREDAHDGWKKALKHKSGVVVHMKNEKTPIFRGETVIQGFSPQSIFYVIGMRRLWDEQYDDGNLVENLNDTTSLTYEVCKATSSLCANSMNRPRDMALVEKIECTRDGAIFFACTSVESPCIPRVQGRVRAQIKLQGWILQPIRGSSLPATRVMYVIQESAKGWVPGFAKKSIARRPLVIALVNEYLQKKADRVRAQKMQAAAAAAATVVPPPVNMNASVSVLSSPAALEGAPNRFQSIRRPSLINLTSSPESIQQQQQQHEAASSRKRITFAEDGPAPPWTITPIPEVAANERSSGLQSDDPQPTAPSPATEQQQQQTRKRRQLYPPHQHLARKNEVMGLVKRLGVSLDMWSLTAEENDIKSYTLVPQEQPSDFPLLLPSLIRVDRSIQGEWTAEQLCSAIQCFGARKTWDSQFLDGHILERFSQKDYLVKWKLANYPPSSMHRTVITSIDTDPMTGVIAAVTCGITNDLKDLDAWVFRPSNLDRKTVDISWISSIPYQIPRLNALEAYIAQHGCPPYIRRVAGKVIEESFNSETGVYDVTYIAKHELGSSSSSSNANKSSNNNNNNNNSHHRRGLWCTDIRTHASSGHPTGFNVILNPETGTRVDMASSTSLRIYTTSAEMEGKRISVQIVPNSRSHQDRPQLTLNGVPLAPAPTITTRTTVSSTVAPITSPQRAEVKAVIPAAEQQHVSLPSLDAPPPTPLPHPTAASSPSLAKPSFPSTSNKKVGRLSADRSGHQSQQQQHQQVLFIPDGYKLIPQQHNSNIIIISDELTFNAQQLALVFLAMVLSYYMGKLASASSYC